MAKGLIQTAHWRSTTLIVSESALILGAVVASAHYMVGGQPWPMVIADTLPKALVIIIVCLLQSPRLRGQLAALWPGARRAAA